MSFGRAFFSSCLGAFAALIFFSLLGFIFFSVLLAGIGSEEKVVVADNSVLHLRLDAQFTELQVDDPFQGLPVVGGEVPKIGLLQLKEAIAHATADDKIKGIYVEASYPMAGFSTIEEIRQSLIDFRKSGKWVIAYNETMSEGAYYLASAADQIYLYPEGEIEFNGLTAEVAFLKKLLDKLEIKPQVFRVGEFKSAVEPFLREEMSEENRLQLSEMINSMHDHLLTRVSASRNIPEEKLRQIADNMEVRNAAAAVQLGLVDSLLYRDQLEQNIKNRLGLGDDDKIRFVQYNKYRKSFPAYKNSKNEIAVIVAEGAIMPGEDDDSQQIIAAESFIKEIKRARNDDDIKAVVLRVNSPGGEFKASDMIWREIELTKQSKPVIASMSDYAASGGYYLSMGCDTIVAQPNTITGSIGIFGVLFDLSSFLDNKLGVTFDEVRTGNYGDTYTVTRPLSVAEKAYIQKMLDDHYKTFTGKAAQGRDMTVEDVLRVASGRVWTGKQALDKNLVDVLGGIDDAIRIAAVKAGVEDDYRVRYMPQPVPFFQQVLTQLEENASAGKVKSELGEYHIWYEQAKKLKTYQGAQARMPFELQIH